MCDRCQCDEYKLPEMSVIWHRLSVDHTRAFSQMDSRGQRRLLLDAAGGVSQASQEKKSTMQERIAKMLEILAAGQPGEQWVIWCYLNSEQDAIETVLKENNYTYSSIYGALDIDETERRLYQWKRKETQILLSKAVMLGSGLNLQQCHKVIFVGVDYKFQDFIQAVHRVYRFMQEHPVDVHIIYAESEDGVVSVLKRKWAQHEELVKKMQGIIRRYGLSAAALQAGLSRKIGVNRVEVKGNLYTAVNNDCVEEVRRLPGNSIGLWHSSLPFGTLYEYSVQFEDFGHNKDNEHFWKQMDFLIPEMLRTLKPGRLAAIHVKDRVLYGHQTKSGFMEIQEFSDDTVKAFKKHGFLYEGRRTIITDVVRENNQTYRLSYGEMLRDASKMGNGMPEYLLLFRKPPSSSENARADEPVIKTPEDYSLGRWQVDAHALWRSNGNRPLLPEELAQYVPEQVGMLFKQEQLTGSYDYERHVAVCEALEKRDRLPKFFMLLPPRVTRDPGDWVWDDVVYMRTLNTAQTQGRREKHLCPLPFDIVERAITLYSNKGDIVGDPFGGLGTVGERAIRLGRQAWLCELNRDYFVDLTQYCQAAEQDISAPSLFDLAQFDQQEALPAD